MRAPKSNEGVWRPCIALACLGLCAMMFSGCASSSSSPTTPSTPQLSGVWLGEQTLTSFTGGECLAPVFQDLLGLPSQFHATLTQSGNSVTATLDIDRTGGVCTYTGSIEGNALVLTTTSCTGTRTLALRCSNGAVRDLLPESESLHATVNVDGMAGSAVEHDTVVVSGTSNRAGTFAGNSTFTLTRQ